MQYENPWGTAPASGSLAEAKLPQRCDESHEAWRSVAMILVAIALARSHLARGGAMPLYEFWCSKCQQTFEVVQSLEQHSKQIPQCPKCNSNEHVKRGVSIFTPITSSKT